jgi:undecaprenyl-phosphate galactose phosphotransferase/putative colanic acid biosynthesis UDP-glucose lipid carrier transferase
MAVSASKYSKQIQYSIDFFIINFAFFDSYFLKFGHLDVFDDTSYFIFLIYYNITWFLISNNINAYQFDALSGIEKLLRDVFTLFGYHILVVSFFWLFIKGYDYSREHLLLAYGILFVLTLSNKLIQFYIITYYRDKLFSFKTTIIIGFGENAQAVASFIQNYPQLGYKFMGYLHDKTYLSGDIIGRTTDLVSISENIHIDEIYYSVADAPNVDIDALAEFADSRVIRLKIIPDFRNFTNKNFVMEVLEGIPIISFRNLPLDDPFNRFVKRSFDILFSGVVVVFLLSWLVPLLSLLIKMESPGPLFFKQKRTGKDNQDFWCLKFRSMRVNTESDAKQATKGDSRITKIGKFMRKTSIDELPQFINVLIGHMSVVGPRPHMLKHTEEYSRIINKYMVRHFVKPGITGLAQVKGYRGETTDPSKMQGRVKYDIFYIENWSFLLDIKIIILTVLNVLKGEENAV